MAMMASFQYRTLPGKFSRHIAVSLEARGRLQAMGYRVAVTRQLMGEHPGVLTTVMSFADGKSWMEASARIQEDSAWTAWYASVADEGVAEHVASALYADIDPQFSPAAPGVIKVARNSLWRPLPGKAAALMDSIKTACGHISRLGGMPRVLHCIEGRYPITRAVSIGFESLAAAGAFLDASNADAQFQAYWAEAMANPSGAIVASELVELMG